MENEVFLEWTECSWIYDFCLLAITTTSYTYNLSSDAYSKKDHSCISNVMGISTRPIPLCPLSSPPLNLYGIVTEVSLFGNVFYSSVASSVDKQKNKWPYKDKLIFSIIVVKRWNVARSMGQMVNTVVMVVWRCLSCLRRRVTFSVRTELLDKIQAWSHTWACALSAVFATLQVSVARDAVLRWCTIYTGNEPQRECRTRIPNIILPQRHTKQ